MTDKGAHTLSGRRRSAVRSTGVCRGWSDGSVPPAGTGTGLSVDADRPSPELPRKVELFDGLVDWPVGGERALSQTDSVQGEGAGGRVAGLDELLDALFVAGVVHPGQRDVRCERVFLGVEPQRCGLALYPLVECGELFAPLVNAQPDDTDVLQTGKHPESTEFGSERAETAVGDSRPDRLPQVGQLFGPRVPEKLQCDVGLLGVGESQASGVGERALYGGYLLGQSVHVRGDEQSHTGYSGRRS